jgi:hypothetical protein
MNGSQILAEALEPERVRSASRGGKSRSGAAGTEAREWRRGMNGSQILAEALERERVRAASRGGNRGRVRRELGLESGGVA